QNTKAFTNPKIELEQYCINASSAVDILFFAGFEYNDIKNRFVVDLGSGTGRLSIASAFLRANSVLSVDLDYNALHTLKENVYNLGLENIIFPLCIHVRDLEIPSKPVFQNLKITTIMNPPFGVKKRTADRVFLKTAFSFSKVVYSIHLAGEKVIKFIHEFSERFNWHIDNYFPHKMNLERSFQFHTEKTRMVDVNVFRFVKNKM
ncbi:MAG: METTL5 family protein, partial [Promethearchaeota archaeon]